MRWRDGLLFLLGLSLGLSAMPRTASAAPPDLFGFGSRTRALGMTGGSYATGWEAVYVNPAGLGATRLRNLTFGFSGGGYQLTIDGEHDPLTPPRGMTIGFALPLPFGDVLEDRIVFGGGFYTPSEVLLRGNIRFPQSIQWSVLDRAQVVAVVIGLGVDLHGLVDGLQLGLSINALANVFGDLTVRLDETNSFSSVVETQLVSSFAPIVGARYEHPNESGGPSEWGLGLSYRHENVSRFELNIVTMDLPIDLPVLTVGGVVQYDPPAVVAEGFWRPIPELMLVLNLTTRIWSAYPGVLIPTTRAGLNAPAPEFSVVPSPRAAIEYELRDDNFQLALRAGYAFEPTPAPAARIAPRRTASGEPVPGEMVPLRMIDNHRHVISAGIGWRIMLGERGESINIEVDGQLHLLMDREHEIGRTDGDPPMTTGGWLGQAGWSIGASF
ncbi:MAG: OmpP1/FadL family transporter [Sandaracinaceae bacterium]